jgi:membrane protein DedA with SNARE-associated domain
MFDQFIAYMKMIDNTSLYAAIFLIAYFENVVPPIPGDVLVAFIGSLISINDLSFVQCLLFSTAGSVAGYLTVYSVWRYFGNKIFNDQNSRLTKVVLKFFPLDNLTAVRLQFDKYGYWLIATNRFFTGTRAIITIFSGMSDLKFLPTLVCAAFSAFVWNVILVYGGYLLGTNWVRMEDYLETYGTVFTIVLIVVGGVLAVRYYYIKKKRASSGNE